ncbi:MAG: hypothetical protein Q6373_001350 [Candidatus Sigynarchaeota archaeon]
MTPAGLSEFTDQPSPFTSAPRESKMPASQKPTFIPFSASAGPQQARPFVQQSPAQVPQPKPVDAQSLAQSRPKNLSSISALAAKGSDVPPAPASRPVRPSPAVSIPSPDAIDDEPPRSASPAPVLTVETSRPPSGKLSNPLDLRGRAPVTPQPATAPSGKDSLEKTMKRELESFKGKMELLPKTPTIPKKEEPAAAKSELPFKEPENLGDVLRDLIKIDPVIKASALVKRDGTILASAISSALSDSLVAIIATTVTTVGSDIMFATESGELKYITFGGTNGIIHIVPTLGDIFLIILTGPNSKQGIISVVAKQVEKGVKTYLNL